ncbi:MAG: type III pantothenate kinase [Bacteroidota bacterium]
MLLAIDIGNTHTVIGVFERDRLIGDWRITSDTARTEDEIGIFVKSFCKNSSIDPELIVRSGISSVVPNLTPIYQKMTKKYFDIEPTIISPALNLGITILYEDPSAVGTDRLCNAVAGYTQYGGPLIIIDFGTATTYDVVSEQGEYLGGVIAPGVETSSAELHRRAAKLPKIDTVFPEKAIGRTTITSMQSGILFGAVDSVEGMVKRIGAELGKKPTVIGTGGLSAMISLQTTVIDFVVPSLVLDGVRIIVDRQK